MRILVVLAHYYKQNHEWKHACGLYAPEERARVVSEAINSLYRLFVLNNMCTYYDGNHDGRSAFRLEQSNQYYKHELKVIICTTSSGEHLLNCLTVPQDSFQWVKVNIDDPRYLPYSCHRVLYNEFMNTRGYDYYCYMEDDCIIRDELFFQKLKWFETTFGSKNILQPHRYSVTTSPEYKKVYGEPELAESYISYWVDLKKNPQLSAEVLGEQITFYKTRNPHCGAFFLSDKQFEIMCNTKGYGQLEAEFESPIESAATLMLMRAFNVYRVDFKWASFFEMEHGC